MTNPLAKNLGEQMFMTSYAVMGFPQVFIVPIVFFCSDLPLTKFNIEPENDGLQVWNLLVQGAMLNVEVQCHCFGLYVNGW